MQRNYDFQIKGSEAMFCLGMDKLNSLRVQSTTIGLVENQFQLKEWKLSRKGKFIRINDDCVYPQHIESTDSK